MIYGGEFKKFIRDICECVKNYKVDLDIIALFNYDRITEYRSGYCQSRMMDKYILPACIEFTINTLKSKLTDSLKINLTNVHDFTDNISINSNIDDNNYYYFPYIITPQELSVGMLLSKIRSPIVKKENIMEIDSKKNIMEIDSKENIMEIDSKEINNKVNILCMKLNFKTNSFNDKSDVDVIETSNNINNIRTYATKIELDKKYEERKDKLKIAIGNVKLNSENFTKIIEKRYKKTYQKYSDLSYVINQALKEKADMLILPESYVPFAWLPIIARTCAKNQLSIVTGIEHFVYEKRVFNFTVNITPYVKDDFKFAHITYHLKTHYSPEERRIIENNFLTPIEGKTYDLINWKNLWFTTYCCFELASIYDRAIFKNYPDLFIAVEWNHDTAYFSSIIESLCRDIHCYCAQVNSSDYGDSRILRPSRSEKRDIVKTKGGINNTILIGEIDIAELRSFQRKDYELQKENKEFKPTPPQFNNKIAIDKINNELWDFIKEDSNKKNSVITK
ncbi:hypothetical protein [Pectinatus cerevisiiphilus]|uniref:Uncharacterized protein n=1 Tax=Pectinatus cerevisiiphilus TaxID=86956 RepID=A0A4R3K1E1_9FIRM|nr:hypothetical protein [Pectinatus cerevisiiphilus]TCS74714.1 hypothetical protein EDC37_1421 [Pectinatus cerevisiiphilus]